jgi:hypothetical protein
MDIKMTKETFKEQMIRLEMCFQRSAPTFSEKMLDVWYGEIKTIDDEDFRQAVTNIVREEKFFPSISTIMKARPSWRKRLII